MGITIVSYATAIHPRYHGMSIIERHKMLINTQKWQKWRFMGFTWYNP